MVAVQQHVPPKRDVLLITKKHTDSYFKERHERQTYFESFQTATWGAGTTGSNSFRCRNTVILATMPFRPQVWAANFLASVRGLDEALEAFREGGSVDSEVARMVEEKALADIVQAVYRTRLRQVTGADGTSLPVDVFVVLPTLDSRYRNKAKRMREAFIQEFPGAEVIDWQVSSRVGQPPSAVVLDLEDKVWGWVQQQDTFTTKQVKKKFPELSPNWNSHWKLRLSGSSDHPVVKALEFNRKLRAAFQPEAWGPVLKWTRRNPSSV